MIDKRNKACVALLEIKQQLQNIQKETSCCKKGNESAEFANHIPKLLKTSKANQVMKFYQSLKHFLLLGMNAF